LTLIETVSIFGSSERVQFADQLINFKRRKMKKAILSLILVFNVSLIYAETPGSFRGKETHGIGFGIEGGLAGSVFYDYALNSSMQIHTLLSSGGSSLSSASGTTTLDTASTTIGATLRYFPSENFGWYVGGGGGMLSASQTMKQRVYCYSSPFTSLNEAKCSGFEGSYISVTTDSTYSGLALWGDAGWQGYDGYYFTIGVKAGTSMKLSEDDKTNEIVAYSNHKSTAQTQWTNIKSPTGLIMTFGWHF